MSTKTNSDISIEDWQKANLERIRNRLAPILADDPYAKIIVSEFQGVFLHRKNNELRLYCFDLNERKLSEIMSRIDLTNPLRLVADYSQAVLLSAAWTDQQPSRIYIAGVGGGRLAMIYHHLFPKLNIDGSDIDPSMIKVCEDHFGLELDDRHDIRIADSREDIKQRDSLYDIIVLDVFFGRGEHPNHLATVEFVKECREKMSPHGVLVANFIRMDPSHETKIAAIADVFDHCHDWGYGGANVIFGSNHKPDFNAIKADVEKRLKNVDAHYDAETQIGRIGEISATDLKAEPLRDNAIKE